VRGGKDAPAQSQSAVSIAPKAVFARRRADKTSPSEFSGQLKSNLRVERSAIADHLVHPRPSGDGAREMSSRIASRTYGTVCADQQKEMTGLEFVRGLADATLPLNTMASTLGYDVTEAESGRVVVTAEPKDMHLNPAGTVHGGLAATMLDSCMGLAIHSTLDKGVGSTTLEFKMSFLRPITPQTGPIRAEGKVISRGRRVGTAEGRVTDEKGRLLVHGTTTCLIFES
jgi:uncharacterized protein (TIGR00369 family)